jgi:hypothetical protein
MTDECENCNRLIEEFLLAASGGSGRRWTARYAQMKSVYEVLTMEQSTASSDFLKGFKYCIDVFEKNPKAGVNKLSSKTF